jgi:predicted nucleotidyltransferase
MRLSDQERQSIRKILLELDPNAQIYLFGSRVDDDKKGGDIDLLILSSKITEKNRRLIKLKLYDALGEQKIDLIITSDTADPFVQIALEHGVLL